MNQPASKEPTMDEILSSIRQIIADDDEAATQKMPAAPKAAVAKAAPAPAPIPMAEPEPIAEHVIDPFSDDDDEGIAPLALSPEQIVEDEVAAEAAMDKASSLLQAAAELVMPDDVAFEQDEDQGEDDAGSLMAAMAAEIAPEPTIRPVVESRPTSFAQAAPMPDPDLASDLTEELLEPATSDAVRSAFSRLNTPRLTPEMALGASGLTIEAMIREMLRPMLKEWLEENLPSMVERIVAAEIERVSRGGN